MKKLLFVSFMLFSMSPLFASNLPTNSVVKVFVAKSTSSYKFPWQTSQIRNSTGSGVIIEGNRILTNAHVVSGARFIEVKKENDHKKYIAQVKYISNQADLAIVEIEDKSFFKNTKALKFNENIKPRDEITVLGYPLGGQTISTTTGVISRIEYVNYVWSAEQLLGIQVDAAINSGNSGGPAIDKDSNIVGIAMMGLKSASNIAYIIPSVIISTFLKDIEDGVVHGFSVAGIHSNFIRNDSVKEFYGLNDDKGILVTSVDYGVENFKKNDILLEIDEKEIANDGTIESKYGRVNASLIIHQKQIGDKVKLKVLRDKQEVEFEHTIQRLEPLIKTEFAKEPRYLIYGGLTFAPLTTNYSYAIGNRANSINMIFYNQGKTEDFTEPVVWMETIFPHIVNRGYRSGIYLVDKVNDEKVKNFKHFVSLMDSLKTEFVVIDTVENVKIIMKVQEAKLSFQALQKIYNLSSDRRVEN